ncbi:hypothetical protein ACFQAT_20980 [Undibacterium arcticum]|uniref:Uncharacterized protein n=1 Tax=Undibacterium arcticum TaxID=1762892 RepID=A0ABV7EWJ8_9BURK
MISLRLEKYGVEYIAGAGCVGYRIERRRVRRAHRNVNINGKNLSMAGG